jgi:putative ABC transport system permease protein
MRALDRKLLRDAWQLKGQGLAIALVMACGVATFVMSVSTMRSLEWTLNSYYEHYRFADVFAHLKRAPEALSVRIAEIPGVAQVQTRVVVDVSLDVPGLAEPAVGRLISVPDYEPPALNRLYLREGRMIEPGRTGEVVVSEGFAKEHKLRPGDSVQAVINGRRQRLQIVGMVLSPEYVYAIREGEILPDEKRFGVFWMARTELAPAFNMEGAFNDVALTLTPDAVEADVLLRLDALTEPYGGIGAFGRSDQMSNRYISNEIEELRGMAIFAPMIFLAVAAFLLNVVISRLIGTQREQIAALKAFGYSNWEVGWHYLKFVLMLSAVGVTLGTIIGAWLGRDMTVLYTRFFHFPSFQFHLGAGVVVAAAGISVVAAVLGTLNAVRRAVSLPPAEAMRPAPPATFRPTTVERLGLQGLLSPAARMILRQIERQPVKSGLSILGIAMAVAVMVLGSYMKDAIEYAMDSQFQFAQRQDLMVTLLEPSDKSTLYDFQHLPGVTMCEPFRASPVRLRHGYRSRRLALLGVEPDAVLNRGRLSASSGNSAGRAGDLREAG